MDQISWDTPESLLDIVKEEQNNYCADCGSDDTEWASLGFGILVCLKCAGYHRSLGTHITSVRSVKLDTWSNEQVKHLEYGGNGNFKKYFEALGTTEMPFLDFSKYSHPKVLYYSQILKGRTQSINPPEYNEDEWIPSAKYAKQAANTFLTSLNHSMAGGSNISEKVSLKSNSNSSKSDAHSPTRHQQQQLQYQHQLQQLHGSSSSSSFPPPKSAGFGTGTPAQWMDDSTAPACLVCQASFTLTTRRHHCRRCGRVVCHNCAPKDNSRPIPEWGLNQPVRHCRLCYKSPAVNWKNSKISAGEEGKITGISGGERSSPVKQKQQSSSLTIAAATTATEGATTQIIVHDSSTTTIVDNVDNSKNENKDDNEEFSYCELPPPECDDSPSLHSSSLSVKETVLVAPLPTVVAALKSEEVSKSESVDYSYSELPSASAENDAEL